MADEVSMALEESLRKAQLEQDVDVPREGVRMLSQAPMELEVTHHMVAPCWQRERAALEHMADRLEATGLFAGERLRAYALVSRAAAGVGILDLGALGESAEEWARDAEALLRVLVGRQARQPVRAINVPPGDPLDEALRRLGCPVMSQQWEMVLAIDGAA
jgi:hypothetical protein